jgi:hypothetical protein
MDVRVPKGKALTTTAPSRPVARPLFSFTPSPRGESCLFCSPRVTEKGEPCGGTPDEIRNQ